MSAHWETAIIATQMRRDVLRMDLGESDGVNVAEEMARDRAGERW